MKRFTSFFMALLFMFSIAMISTKAENTTLMNVHGTIRMHEKQSKLTHFDFRKGTAIIPRRAPACGA